MRFMHCSDVHLGRKPAGGQGDYARKRYDDYFSAFGWAVKLAVENKPDAFIISGDFFDKKELQPEVLEKAENLLMKLKENEIQVILIEGNHDNISFGSEQESWLYYLQRKGLFLRPKCYFDETYKFDFVEIQGVRFFGLGYPGSFVNETIEALSEYLIEEDESRNVVIIHTAIGSAAYFPGTVQKEVVEKLKGKAIYVAAGHFHSFNAFPSENPYFFIPGSLEYWDTNEFLQDKGAIIFDTGTRTYEFHHSEKRHALDLKFELDAESPEEALQLISQFIGEHHIEKGESLVRLSININNPVLIESEKIEDMFLQRGALKSFIRINIAGDFASADIKSPLLTVNQIEREIIAGWSDFSNQADYVAGKLEILKQEQKANNRDLFFEQFDSLLTQIIDGGQEDEN